MPFLTLIFLMLFSKGYPACLADRKAEASLCKYKQFQSCLRYCAICSVCLYSDELHLVLNLCASKGARIGGGKSDFSLNVSNKRVKSGKTKLVRFSHVFFLIFNVFHSGNHFYLKNVGG